MSKKKAEIFNCPKCNSPMFSKDGFYHCEVCGRKFKMKTNAPEEAVKIQKTSDIVSAQQAEKKSTNTIKTAIAVSMCVIVTALIVIGLGVFFVEYEFDKAKEIKEAVTIIKEHEAEILTQVNTAEGDENAAF